MIESEAGPRLDGQHLPCPACARPTRSLKRFGLMKRLLFLGIGYRMWRERCTSCPGCMRRRLLKNAFNPVSILTANVMWPLAVVPYTGILLAATLVPGQSTSVARQPRSPGA